MSLENLPITPSSQLVEPMSETSAVGAQTPEHLDAENAESDPTSAPAYTQASDKDVADSAASESAAPAAPMKMFKAMFRPKGGVTILSSGNQTPDSKSTKVAEKKKEKDEEDKKKKKKDEDEKKKKKKPVNRLA